MKRSPDWYKKTGASEPSRIRCNTHVHVDRQDGIGAHVWIFVTDPVPAATARQLGTALVREAIAIRGRMDLRCYDRLFPSQDVLPGKAPAT
jgi:hypothetical protein